MATDETWFWCTTHRERHRSDESGQHGCTLAGPNSTLAETIAFGRRVDPERFNET
jgi:hypothetical protein